MFKRHYSSFCTKIMKGQCYHNFLKFCGKVRTLQKWIISIVENSHFIIKIHTFWWRIKKKGFFLLVFRRMCTECKHCSMHGVQRDTELWQFLEEKGVKIERDKNQTWNKIYPGYPYDRWIKELDETHMGLVKLLLD